MYDGVQADDDDAVVVTRLPAHPPQVPLPGPGAGRFMPPRGDRGPFRHDTSRRNDQTSRRPRSRSPNRAAPTVDRDFSGLLTSTGLEELYTPDETKWESLYQAWQDLDEGKKLCYSWLHAAKGCSKRAGECRFLHALPDNGAFIGWSTGDNEARRPCFHYDCEASYSCRRETSSRRQLVRATLETERFPFGTHSPENGPPPIAAQRPRVTTAPANPRPQVQPKANPPTLRRFYPSPSDSRSDYRASPAHKGGKKGHKGGPPALDFGRVLPGVEAHTFHVAVPDERAFGEALVSLDGDRHVSIESASVEDTSHEAHVATRSQIPAVPDEVSEGLEYGALDDSERRVLTVTHHTVRRALALPPLGFRERVSEERHTVVRYADDGKEEVVLNDSWIKDGPRVLPRPWKGVTTFVIVAVAAVTGDPAGAVEAEDDGDVSKRSFQDLNNRLAQNLCCALPKAPRNIDTTFLFRDGSRSTVHTQNATNFIKVEDTHKWVTCVERITVDSDSHAVIQVMDLRRVDLDPVIDLDDEPSPAVAGGGSDDDVVLLDGDARDGLGRGSSMSRRERNAQLQANAVERDAQLKEYFRRMHPSLEEHALDMMVHCANNHQPFLRTCLTCVEANQKKSDASQVSDPDKPLQDRWHLDCMGRCSVLGEGNNRYVLGGRVEVDKDLIDEPLASKLSTKVVDALRAVAQRKKSWPKALVSGNDAELKGAVHVWADHHKVLLEKKPRYRPEFNGVAEAAIYQLQRLTIPALLWNGADATLWPRAMRHSTDTWRMRMGIIQNFPFELVGPFACLCLAVYEKHERGFKFGPKSWRGFHAGYVYGTNPPMIEVGFDVFDSDGNKTGHDYRITNNVTVIPSDRYWEQRQSGPDPLELEFEFEQPEREQDPLWVRTDCCGGKWRLATHGSREFWKKQKNVTCEDLDCTCGDPEDPAVYEAHSMFVLEPPGGRADDDVERFLDHGAANFQEVNMLDFAPGVSGCDVVFEEPRSQGTGDAQDGDRGAQPGPTDPQTISESLIHWNAHENYAFEACSKKKAFSEEMWFGSEFSYRHMFEKATDKELESFLAHQSFDGENPISLSEVREQYPDSTVCLMNLILGTKQVERWYSLNPEQRKGFKAEEHLKAKARLVVFKELLARTMKPAERRNFEEGLYSSTPSDGGLRCFLAMIIVAGKVALVADQRQAFQGAPARDRSPVFAVIPEVLWRCFPRIREMFRPGQAACLPVLGSLYGRYRASQDHDRYTMDSLISLCWTPMFDVENALYVLPEPDPAILEFATTLPVWDMQEPPASSYEFPSKPDERWDESEVSELKLVKRDVADLNAHRTTAWAQLDAVQQQVALHDEVSAEEHNKSKRERDFLVKKSRLPAWCGTPIEDLPDIAARYVDDIIVSGRSLPVAICHYASLCTFCLVGPPMLLQGEKYNGVTTEVNVVTKDNGTKEYRIRWQQVDLIKKYVNEFTTEYTKRTGKSLRVRATPAPSSNAHTPMTREQEAVKAKKDAAVADVQEKQATMWGDDNLTWVNKLAYLQQHTIPKLSFIIRRLQSKASKWTVAEDKLLVWVYGFLAGQPELSLIGWISEEDVRNGELYVLTESDCSQAGDRDDRSSVGGYATYLRGPGTSILLDWNAFKLGFVALSSMEGETGVMQAATKSNLHIKMCIDIMLGIADPGFQGQFIYGVSRVLRADAMAAIRAVKKAASTKVRHMRRTLGISCSWLNRVWSEDENSFLTHHKGTYLTADQFTKSLDAEMQRRHDAAMGQVS